MKNDVNNLKLELIGYRGREFFFLVGHWVLYLEGYGTCRELFPLIIGIAPWVGVQN